MKQFSHQDMPYWDVMDGNFETVLFEDLDLPGLLLLAGKFRSRTEAKKNGFGGPIPPGYTEMKVGKTEIIIYNKLHWLTYVRLGLEDIAEWLENGHL